MAYSRDLHHQPPDNDSKPFDESSEDAEEEEDMEGSWRNLGECMTGECHEDARLLADAIWAEDVVVANGDSKSSDDDILSHHSSYSCNSITATSIVTPAGSKLSRRSGKSGKSGKSGEPGKSGKSVESSSKEAYSSVFASAASMDAMEATEVTPILLSTPYGMEEVELVDSRLADTITPVRKSSSYSRLFRSVTSAGSNLSRRSCKSCKSCKSGKSGKSCMSCKSGKSAESYLTEAYSSVSASVASMDATEATDAYRKICVSMGGGGVDGNQTKGHALADAIAPARTSSADTNSAIVFEEFQEKNDAREKEGSLSMAEASQYAEPAREASLDAVAEPAYEGSVDSPPPTSPPLPPPPTPQTRANDTPRPKRVSFFRKLKSTKVFGRKSVAKNEVGNDEVAISVICDLPNERYEVELTDPSDLPYNSPDGSRGMDPADETPIISKEVITDSEQSRCSNITEDMSYDSSSTVNAKYNSEDLEEALVVERKTLLSNGEPSTTNANFYKELEASVVERNQSAPNEENYTGGLIGKLLACSQIPFQCSAGGYEDDDSATYRSKKAASGEPALPLHDDDVDESLNVEAYEGSKDNVTRIGFFDREVTVDPSLQNSPEENAMSVSSSIILKTRMTPGFEIDDIARRLQRRRNRVSKENKGGGFRPKLQIDCQNLDMKDNENGPKQKKRNWRKKTGLGIA